MSIGPIRLVQLVNTFSISDGGPARYAMDLAQSLERRHMVVDTVSMSSDLALVEIAARSPSFIATPPRKLALRTTDREISLFEVITRLGDSDALIINGYFLWWVPPAVVLAKLRNPGIRILVIPHGSLTSWQQQFSRRKKRLWEVLVGPTVRHRVDTFVAESEIERHDLETKFPAIRAQSISIGTVLPEGIARRQPHDPIRLLTMSRIAPKKHIDVCIEAVSVLTRAGRDVRLRIAGDGDKNLVSALRELVSARGIDDRVEFIGLVEAGAKAAEYRDADVFLLPSDDENFGIGVAEAAAYGLPVVCSDKVAAAHLISDEARRFTPSTGEGLAEGIVAMVADGYQQRSAAARRSAELSFSWESVAERWERMLRDEVRTMRFTTSDGDN